MNYEEIKDDNKNLSYVELLKKLKHTEEKLLESTNEADKLKSLFLANISHEIRTPMNAILGFSGLLREKKLSEEDKNSFIDGITESSHKLLSTIDSIIQTAKIESKELSLKEEACDIDYLMSELFSSYNKNKGNIGKGHIELRIKKEANGNPWMLTDNSKLKQILSNLIDNALQFTESGYIVFGYEFTNKSTIQFFVKDTGIGIPTDKYNTIFETFNQVETQYNRKQTGLGVGLSISNNFAQQLGGTMGVRSNINRGSEFYISLPYVPADIPNTVNSDNQDLVQTPHWLKQILKNSKNSKAKIEIYSNWSHYSA